MRIDDKPNDSMNTPQEPIIYNVEDLRRIFGMGKRQAYSLMHEKGFPSFKIGKKLFVEHTALQKWIGQHRTKQALNKPINTMEKKGQNTPSWLRGGKPNQTAKPKRLSARYRFASAKII